MMHKVVANLKKNKLWLCIIIFSSIFLIILGGIGIDRLIFSVENGPYHHAAIVDTLSDVVSIKDNNYVINKQKLYRLTDNKIVEENIELDNEEYLCDIGYNENTNEVYISTQKQNGIEQISYLYILDENMKRKEKILTNEIFVFVISDNWLYYTELYSSNNIQKTKLKRFSPLSLEKEYLGDFNKNRIIVIGDNTFYCPYDGSSYLELINIEDEYIKLCSLHNWEIPFVINDSFGIIKNNQGEIIVNYNEEQYTIKQGDCFVRFYSFVYVYKNKVIFASYNENKKDVNYIECEDNIPDCICMHDNSYVWEFNISTKEIRCILEIKSTSYLIGIEKENIYYYKDSAIYKNNEKLYKYPTIEIKGKFYREGVWYAGYEDDSHVSINYFCLYKEKVYHYYLDCSHQIKDRYYL